MKAATTAGGHPVYPLSVTERFGLCTFPSILQGLQGVPETKDCCSLSILTHHWKSSSLLQNWTGKAPRTSKNINLDKEIVNCIWDQDWLCPNRGSDSMPVMSFKWSWLENLARCHESWDWCGTTKLHEDDMKCNSAMAWKYVFPRPWVDYRAKCFPGCTDAFLTWDCTYNKGQAPGSHSSAHRQKPLDCCLEQSSLSRRAACFSDSRCEDLNSKSQPQISSFRAPLELATKFCRRLGAGAKTPFPLSNAVSDLDTDPIALQPDNLLTKPWQLDCFRLVLYQSKWGLQYNEPLWIPWWIWFSKGFLNLLIIFFFADQPASLFRWGPDPKT